MRQQAIEAYKENLNKFDQNDIDGLQYLVQKGMAMEQWQGLIKENENEQVNKKDGSIEQQFTENKEDFMKKVIQNNINVSKEIRGVMINGDEKRGI